MHNSLRFAFILAFALIFWTQDLNRPFIGHFDISNATWTVYADNVQRYGLVEVRFGDVANITPAQPEDFVYNNFHPPMLTGVVLIGHSLLPDSEFATRVGMVWLTMLTAAAFYAFARRIVPQVAMLATLFFCLLPIVMYYSQLTTQEMINLLWFLLTLYFFSKWLATDENRWRNLMMLVAVGGAFTDWVYYLLIGYIGLYTWFTVGFRRATRLIPVLAVCLVVLGIFMGLGTWQSADYIENWFGRLDARTLSQGDSDSGYPGFFGWMAILGVRSGQVFTPIVILFAFEGFRLLWKRYRKGDEGMVNFALPLLPFSTVTTLNIVSA